MESKFYCGLCGTEIPGHKESCLYYDRVPTTVEVPHYYNYFPPDNNKRVADSLEKLVEIHERIANALEALVRHNGRVF